MTREEKIICKHFLNDADKTHSCNEYKLLMALLEQEPTTKNDLGVDYILRADYENRLKADLVAMLTEIELEIEEMDSGCGWEGYRPTAQVIGLIQQRINSLKENEDGQKAK